MKSTSSAASFSGFKFLRLRDVTPRAGWLPAGVSRMTVFVFVVGVFLGSFYFTSSASSSNKVTLKQNSAWAHTMGPRVEAAKVADGSSLSPMSSVRPWSSTSPLTFPEPQSPGAMVATFAADCLTPQTVFAVGQTVCVKASGVPLSGFFPRRLTWAAANSSIVRSTDLSTDPQTDSFLIDATSISGSSVVDNRGTWQVAVTNPFFYFSEAIATFTVIDPANTTADLGVTATFTSDSVQVGSQAVFALQVNNYGPDSALNVRLTNSVPADTSFLSFQQLSGPSFTCDNPAVNGIGLTTCSIASMGPGEVATFVGVYEVNSGTEITNTTSVSSIATQASPAISDLNDKNDSISVTISVKAGGGSQCSLTCPPSLSFDNDPGTGGHVISSADFPLPVATGGDCGSVSTTVSPDPATNNYVFLIGTTFVTASTESGETCTFTVTINDVENPTVSCPADITTFESSPGSGANVNFAVIANDNSGSADVSCDRESGSNFPVGTTPVTCTATDSSGNSSPSCSFNVTVNAVNTTCVLTTQAPIVVNSDANACGTHVTYTTPTSDGSGSCGTITCNRASGSFFGEGETIVTCTSNPDGASTSFTVTVNDTTAPVPDLSSLPTITRDCTANAGIPVVITTPGGPQTVFEPPTATDNCGGEIQGSTNDPRVYQDPGTYTVHWTYTDARGNTNSQNQTIVVTGSDTTAPVPDVATLPTVTDECSATVVTSPTATDDCDGTLTATTPDPLTYTGAGTYTVHWTYTDQAGNSSHQNQTVVVTDLQAPTIELVGPSSVTVECHTSFADPSVTTTDDCVPKNVTVTTTGSVDVNTPNTYTITYTATDGGGNQASVDRTVIVQDTMDPIITLNGAASMTVECHTSFTDPGATASDACDANVPVTVSGSVDINVPGSYTLTYDAVDDSANPAASVHRTVTVVDTTAPTINCPANITVYLPLNTTATSTIVNFTAPVGTDSCGATTTTQAAGLPSGASFPVGTTTNTFTVTDASNNSASCSFTVTVLYNFTGFFSPVSNLPALNSVNAGRAIPVKFSLSGNKGLNILAPDSPYSVSFNCDTNDPGVDVIETVTAGDSSLSFGGDQYNYVWKTQSSWAGSCRQLVLRLNDGSVHSANFRFR